MRLQVENLTFSYGECEAADNVCLHVEAGEFIGLIGPNGSGKSTVLNNIYRALTPDRGTITLDGENLLKMSHKRSALKLAVVGQENDVPFNFLVEEIVAMGRSPHKRLFDIDNAYDKYIVKHALAHLGMEDMAKRNYLNLSGGEKQRVIIARAIAQESDFFILDEPTNHLDISYQMQVFDFIKRLKVTVLSAIHDLNMAALYCDRLYVLKAGRIVLRGTPEEVFTPENIYGVYGVRSSVGKHPITGKTAITFLPAEIKEDSNDR
ncbi:MAG: ABC transporter ATP-binding protein [Oscillospiraceae bacterium]|jgi:iron complex transport system ATP-binding protein|nr:ABC transporter ATP-binding protein [Oscillospiraceae bacterium]